MSTNKDERAYDETINPLMTKLIEAAAAANWVDLDHREAA